MAGELTIKLDEELAAKVQREAERTGTAPEEVLKDAARRGFREPFEIKGPFATSRPGVGSFDCISRLLEEVEGPEWK